MLLQEKKHNVKSSGNFKSSHFGFEQNSVAFEVLSSTIYTHKVRAVIRETCCNALDAQEEAGCGDKRFRVVLPTSWEPEYSVRDYGTGLKDEEVRGYNQCKSCGTEYNLSDDRDFCTCKSDLEFQGGIYNTYFKSTKRDKEKAIGALGLGTKSPFCLVDSFTVDSWCDGIHNSYSCYINEDGEPDVARLFSKESDEPNGVRVAMSVKDKAWKFQDEAVNVFRHFDVLPIIENGPDVLTKIENINKEYVISGDDYKLTGKKHGTAYALMGCVAYAIPDNYINLDGIIEFPLGSLKFNPGREYLSMDDRTIEVLRSRVEGVLTDLAYDMFKEIKNEKGAYKRARKLDTFKRGLFSSLSFEDQNRLRFFAMKPVDGFTFKVFQNVYGEGFQRISNNTLSVGKDIEYYRVDDDMSVRGYTGRIKEHSGSKKIALVTDAMIKYFDIPTEEIYNLDDLPELPKRSSAARSNCKVFKFNPNGYKKDAWVSVDIDLSDDVERVYVEISRFEPVNRYWSVYNVKSDLKMISEYLGEDVELYGIKSALIKQKSFENSEFIHLMDFISNNVTVPKDFYKTDDDYLVRNFSKILDYVDDELLLKINIIEKRMKRQIDSGLIRDWSEVEVSYEVDDLISQVRDKYPMLKFLSGSQLTDEKTIDYMKMIKSQEKELTLV